MSLGCGVRRPRHRNPAVLRSHALAMTATEGREKINTSASPLDTRWRRHSVPIMGPADGKRNRLASYVAEPAELDVVVAEIRAIERRTGLDRALAIGRLVFERFFGGSVQAWKERRKNKNNSVRRLAQHPLCPLSRSAINQAIGI